MNTGLTPRMVNALIIDPLAPSMLHVGTHGCVFSYPARLGNRTSLPRVIRNPKLPTCLS